MTDEQKRAHRRLSTSSKRTVHILADDPETVTLMRKGKWERWPMENRTLSLDEIVVLRRLEASDAA